MKRQKLQIQKTVLGFSEEPDNICPPRTKSNRLPSAVKPESVGCFRSSLSSFLAFVPLKLLKSMVYYSNMYADSVELDGVATSRLLK